MLSPHRIKEKAYEHCISKKYINQVILEYSYRDSLFLYDHHLVNRLNCNDLKENLRENV